MKVKGMLPIVIISFQDHSADLEGEAKPFFFKAVGVVLKSTAEGYTLGHWVDVTERNSLRPEVTTYVAKVKGLKIETIGHMIVE